MANGESVILENVFGTLATILWTIQLAPQVVHNWRRKSCEGMSIWMMLLWFFGGLVQALFFVYLRLTIPLMIQPHGFGLLSMICSMQFFYYGPSLREFFCFNSIKRHGQLSTGNGSSSDTILSATAPGQSLEGVVARRSSFDWSKHGSEWSRHGSVLPSVAEGAELPIWIDRASHSESYDTKQHQTATFPPIGTMAATSFTEHDVQQQQAAKSSQQHTADVKHNNSNHHATLEADDGIHSTSSSASTSSTDVAGCQKAPRPKSTLQHQVTDASTDTQCTSATGIAGGREKAAAVSSTAAEAGRQGIAFGVTAAAATAAANRGLGTAAAGSCEAAVATAAAVPETDDRSARSRSDADVSIHLSNPHDYQTDDTVKLDHTRQPPTTPSKFKQLTLLCIDDAQVNIKALAPGDSPLSIKHDFVPRSPSLHMSITHSVSVVSQHAASVATSISGTNHRVRGSFTNLSRLPPSASPLHGHPQPPQSPFSLPLSPKPLSTAERVKAKWKDMLALMLIFTSIWALTEYLLIQAVQSGNAPWLKIIVGTIPPVCGIIGFLPQIVECVMLKSTQGVSVAFLMLDFFGGSFGALSLAFHPGSYNVLAACSYLAVVVGDIVLVLLHVYYSVILSRKADEHVSVSQHGPTYTSA